MTTASTEWPPSISYRVLVVRPRSAGDTAIGASELIRKSAASADLSALGRSRISSKLLAPRPSHDHTCSRRYDGAPCSASQPSSSGADRERIEVTRLGYRPL